MKIDEFGHGKELLSVEFLKPLHGRELEAMINMNEFSI